MNTDQELYIKQLEEEIADLQEQLDAQADAPTRQNYERLLGWYNQEKRMSGCLGRAAEHAQNEEKKLTEEVASLKKQLQFVTDEVEDWKQQYKILGRELDEANREISDLIQRVDSD